MSRRITKNMIGIVVTAAIIILVLFNETNLFYKEDSSYKIPEKRRFLCEEAAPFHYRNGSDKLILFVHGFPSTPAVYRWAAEELSKEGWDCAAPLLPGFGTDWHDLLNTNFSQWYAYLSDYYKEMKKSYKKIFVVGTSMGGTLTLKLAEEYSPDGIVTIAAPVFINKVFFYGVLKNPAFYLVRSAGWLIKAFKPENITAENENNLDGRGRWRGYNGIYPQQTYSLKLGMKDINKNLKKITSPYLALHDRHDRTVPFKNVLHIAGKVSSTNLEVKIVRISNIDHEHHNLLIYDSTRQMVLDRIKAFIGNL